MKKTVEFYAEVLGLPLTKMVVLPGGGQHFSLIVAVAISWPSSGFQPRLTLNQALFTRQAWQQKVISPPRRLR
jgi:hypothetical protein